MKSKTCLFCGKEFKTFPCKIKEGKGKYCSKQCSYSSDLRNKNISNAKKGVVFTESWRKNLSIAHLGKNKGSDHYYWKGGKGNCLTCGKPLALYSYRTKTSMCKKHSIKKGAEHPAWKGGIDKNKLERIRFRRYIRDAVFKRDDYTCQMCNKRGIELHVDHIQPWSEYPKLRFSMDNCRTLCVDCHYLLTWGKKKPEYIKSWGRNLRPLNKEVQS